MDRAKQNYSIGKQRTVTAEELEKNYINTIHSNSRQFICPECGEYVAFVRRFRYKSYFRHCNSNETTKTCDLRSQSHQNLSIYERVGLPLYLKRCTNNIFELYLGFLNLDEMQINTCMREEYKISINPLNEYKSLTTTYLVNDNNFSLSSTVLKRIDFISQKYKINYSSCDAEKLLSKRWGTDVEGILSTGSLFTYSENGGRKIKINDEITTDTEYFYLSKDGNVINKYNSIDSEWLGKIQLKSSINFRNSFYNVYKIRFKNCSEDEFRKMNNFCRDNFKVSLIYKPSTLIAMWPPSIQEDNEISFFKDGNESLFIIKSYELNPRVFIHRDSSNFDFKGLQIDHNKYLIKIPIATEKVALTINEKYNSIFVFLNIYKEENKKFNSWIYIKDNNNNLINRGVYYELPTKKMVEIRAESKCDIIHFKNKKIYEYYKVRDKNGIFVSNIGFGDKILAVSGIKYILLLEYSKNYTKQKYAFNDELQYNHLCKLGEPFVPPPIWIKKLLLLLKDHSKTFSLVRGFLITNKMPEKANRTLMDVYKMMKAGVNHGE